MPTTIVLAFFHHSQQSTLSRCKHNITSPGCQTILNAIFETCHKALLWWLLFGRLSKYPYLHAQKGGELTDTPRHRRPWKEEYEGFCLLSRGVT